MEPVSEEYRCGSSWRGYRCQDKGVGDGNNKVLWAGSVQIRISVRAGVNFSSEDNESCGRVQYKKVE